MTDPRILGNPPRIPVDTPAGPYAYKYAGSDSTAHSYHIYDPDGHLRLGWTLYKWRAGGWDWVTPAAPTAGPTARYDGPQAAILDRLGWEAT